MLQKSGQYHSLPLQRFAGLRDRQNGCLCKTSQSCTKCYNSLYRHQVQLLFHLYARDLIRLVNSPLEPACWYAAEQAAQDQQSIHVADTVLDPELAEFQAEIGAIEAETAEASRAETPPPDQQRFQDDDGTTYAWDSNLRRFVPAGEELPGTSYDPADMVYEAEDEKIPAMPAVLQVSLCMHIDQNSHHWLFCSREATSCMQWATLASSKLPTINFTCDSSIGKSHVSLGWCLS